jgi:hypothetical protein
MSFKDPKQWNCLRKALMDSIPKADDTDATGKAEGRRKRQSQEKLTWDKLEQIGLGELE